jgi:hypothetical protein
MNIGLWILGALLGVRHAFEPDHVAAVAAMVTGPARTRGATRLGATWGLGHSAALLLAATLIALGRSTLHASVGDTFELLVGAMLVALGALRVSGALRRRRAVPGGAARDATEAEGAPFTVGVVHGLAGSGALTALAASQLQSTAGRLAYVALFGLGSIIGMSALAGLGGRLLSRLAARPAVVAGLALVTGALTLALGVVWLRRFWP